MHLLKKMSFVAFIFIFFACEQEPLTNNVQSQQKQTEIAPEELQAQFGRTKTFGKIVVANRASGSISVIDVKTDQVSGTYQIPDNGEPMYVVWSPRNESVWVGDRTNNRVVVFDANDFSIKGFVDAGNGVFHMWGQPNSNDLWVVNDIDNTISVIDMAAIQNVATVPLPQDLTDKGGKPHDVITGPFGRLAYVSMLGFAGSNDYVVQYDMRSYRELNRAEVGKDPHLSLHPRVNQNLYVPAQNSSAVYVLDRLTMEEQTVLNIPGAHGAGMAWDGQTFYTTNLPGGGADGLYAINTTDNSIIGSVDTYEGNFLPVPHNIALTPTGNKLYVTHSGGSSDKVTVYTIDSNNLPVFLTEVEVGFNPFGLAYSVSAEEIRNMRRAR